MTHNSCCILKLGASITSSTGPWKKKILYDKEEYANYLIIDDRQAARGDYRNSLTDKQFMTFSGSSFMTSH